MYVFTLLCSTMFNRRDYTFVNLILVGLSNRNCQSSCLRSIITEATFVNSEVCNAWCYGCTVSFLPLHCIKCLCQTSNFAKYCRLSGSELFFVSCLYRWNKRFCCIRSYVQLLNITFKNINAIVSESIIRLTSSFWTYKFDLVQNLT